MEGSGKTRNVVTEFPSFEDAVKCWNSPGYQAARAKRDGAGEVDIVIVEGFKSEVIDKIECFRAEARNPLIYPEDPRILAIASDTPMPDADRPVFDLSDTAAIADFVAARSGLNR